MDRIGRFGGGLVALVVAAIVPTFFQRAYQFDAAVTVLYALVILSLVLLTGYVGQISFCQATFMGLSAFTTSALVVGLGMNYWVAAAIGTLAAAMLGVAVGLPALRLRGILLAIVTVAVALTFDEYFFKDQSFGWLNGGVSGWSINGASLFGIQLDAAAHIRSLYWVLLVVFAVVAVLVVNIHDSGSGRRFRAIRDSELAAATMGVDLTRYKLMAFALAAGIAGLAGAFFPLVFTTVTYPPFSLFYSLQFAAFGVLMGIRYVPAAALGGFFGAFVPDLLKSNFEVRYDYFTLVLGVLLVVQLIVAPDGVWGDMMHRAEHINHAVTHVARRVMRRPKGALATP
ncbi:MAG: branched-chain amino acid ABC transporter permease [Candidatus Dormibacteria bacterium]